MGIISTKSTTSIISTINIIMHRRNCLKEYISSLSLEQRRLDGIIQQIKSSLINVPDGKLRICYSKGSVQYYIRKNPGDMTGTYIRKKNIDMVKALAQKEYDEKMLSVYEKKKKIIDKFIERVSKLDTESMYSEISEIKKSLISPYEVDDETYKKLWENVKYEGKSFENTKMEIYTEKGERVRSKSEKLIADKLYLMNIPYRYEFPIKLCGYGVVYPDFTLLDVKSRKEYILEHFGMMDNAEYCEQAISKINMYEKNGIVNGEKLIVTFETSNMPIDMRMFEKKMKVILM